MIGYKYFKTGEYYFREHLGALIPLSMPHGEVLLDERNQRDLLSEKSALFVRWDTNFDQLAKGKWWHVIKDAAEKKEVLSSSTRSKVNRGTKRFRSELRDKQFVMDYCYLVYVAASERYDTHEKLLKQEEFRRAIEQLPDATEFWVVTSVESGEVCAFSENLVMDEACFYLSIWFTPEALKSYVSYYTFHEMNKHYLNERGLKYVSDGARSISHDTNIHEFLLSKFGFRKAYACLNVVYVPWFGLLVRMLYPFRGGIKKLPGNLFKKVSIVLFQEQIRRSCSSQTKALES